MSLPSSQLADVPFPQCALQCAAIEKLGVGECESCCPEKFGTGELIQDLVSAVQEGDKTLAGEIRADLVELLGYDRMDEVEAMIASISKEG